MNATAASSADEYLQMSLELCETFGNWLTTAIYSHSHVLEQTDGLFQRAFERSSVRALER